MSDEKDINIGDRVMFFDETSTHKKGLVIDIIDRFPELGTSHPWNFKMPKTYFVSGDDSEEYELDLKGDYLERDYITERDIKIDNILKDKDE